MLCGNFPNHRVQGPLTHRANRATIAADVGLGQVAAWVDWGDCVGRHGGGVSDGWAYLWNRGGLAP